MESVYGVSFWNVCHAYNRADLARLISSVTQAFNLTGTAWPAGLLASAIDQGVLDNYLGLLALTD